MSLMRRNKLRIIPNVARKSLIPEKCEANLPIKLEKETNNNIKKELVSNNNTELPKEHSDNSLKIISNKSDLIPTVFDAKLVQTKFCDSNLINSTNSLNSTVDDTDSTSGLQSIIDNNNENVNLPISVEEECLKSVKRVEGLSLLSATDEETSLRKKTKDVKTDFISSSKTNKKNFHENSTEQSITDNCGEMNSNKQKQQLSKEDISFSPKKCSKKFQNLSRGGKENAVASKLALSPTNNTNETEKNSFENTETKKEKIKSFLNPSKKHKPKSLETKNSPYFQRKSKYRSKLTPSGELEKSKMTMFDLIFWNPVSNPMPQTQNDREIFVGNYNNQNDMALARIEEQNAEEEGLETKSQDTQISENKVKLNEEEDPVQNNDSHGDEDHASESEEEPASLAPQVKIGPNGELVVDEKSLLIQTTAAKNRDKVFSTAEVIEEDNNSSHYGKWSKRKKKSTEWTLKETARFYKALSTVGTDFSLMSMILNWRTRAELKIKFKKEERTNRHLIDMALSDSTQFDFTIFDESDYDPEEDRKNSKEAEKAEAKKKKEDERRERKLQRAKERKLKLEQEKSDKNRKKKLKSMYKKSKRRKRVKLVVGEEPIESKRKKRKLSVIIDPQEVICEVVFSSPKPVENNCTVSENETLEDNITFPAVDPLSTEPVPVVDVGEDDTLTISQNISFDEHDFEEEEEEIGNKKSKEEFSNSCGTSQSNTTDTEEDVLNEGSSQPIIAAEIREPSEDFKNPNAIQLPIHPYVSPEEELVLMPAEDPCNPSKQIFHVFRVTKNADVNQGPSSESTNALNNNNDSNNDNSSNNNLL